MEIQFCGAARFVTGSSHLITLDSGFKILLDCGLYQGNEKDMADFNEQFYYKPAEIDCVILSHAHIDHSGRLPKLVKDGFDGTIYCTHATRSLCSIMLLDSAKIQERDAEYYNKKLAKKKKKHKTNKKKKEALYTSENVKQTMNLFAGYSYNRWVDINPFLSILFRDAGHILGSASVTLKIKEGEKETLVGFTGDIGRPNRPILRDPKPMPEVDYLICESTYGDRLHEAPPQQEEDLLNIIKETCIENRGKLIIPAFSVGRTQEIVYILDQLESAGRLPRIPIYVDSPLAVNATQVFGAHPECYDNDLNEYLLIDENPFGFNNLEYVRNVEISKSLNHTDNPCIIISSSGMMNAGRVRHHLANSIDNPRHTFLIVGYCSPDTPGGMLKAGIKEIKLFGEIKPVLAQVKTMHSFSAHGDKLEMMDFVRNQRKSVKKMFLVHGEYDVQEHFKTELLKFGFEKVDIPKLGSRVALS